MPKKTEIGAIESKVKGGRPIGIKNKSTRILKEAALIAAESIGEDGAGKDGLVGYLRTSAILERAAYLSFLGKLIPQQVAVSLPQYRRIDQAALTFVENQALLNDRIRAMRAGEHIKIIEHIPPIPEGETELKKERDLPEDDEDNADEK